MYRRSSWRAARYKWTGQAVGEWLASRYSRMFAAYPCFDGVVLTFEESPYRVVDEAKVQSTLSVPDRFAKIINVIDEVCRRKDKDLIVRSFLYEPEQTLWLKKATPRRTRT